MLAINWLVCCLRGAWNFGLVPETRPAGAWCQKKKASAIGRPRASGGDGRGVLCFFFSVGLGQSAKTNILIIELISEDGIFTRGVVALSRHRRVLDAH